MMDNDRIWRFLFEDLGIRGEIVHLSHSFRAILENQDYPDPVRSLLGQALAATSLLAETIKFHGALILQVQSQGPTHLLVTQATSRRTVRGLAHWHEQVPYGTLQEICGSGTLTITIEPVQGEAYQGIVSLDGITLAECLEHYFAKSEQLPTRLWLFANHSQATGLLLQQIPSGHPDLEAWNHIAQLGATVTGEELLGLDPVQLLWRLFHEENVRLFEGEALSFQCSCSRERIESVLRALGENEIRQLQQEQDLLRVNCEFCNHRYEFDAVDIGQLFAINTPREISREQH